MQRSQELHRALLSIDTRVDAKACRFRSRGPGGDAQRQARFESFDDYWQPFLGGQGPAPAYAMSLDEAGRASLRDRIRKYLPTAADGSISLIARAWAARATVVT